MNDSHIQTLEQVRQFLSGVAVMEIAIPSKSEGYGWIQGTLVRFQYLTLGKADRGLIRRYLQHISGYSRAQVARLISKRPFQAVIALPVPGLISWDSGRTLFSTRVVSDR